MRTRKSSVTCYATATSVVAFATFAATVRAAAPMTQEYYCMAHVAQPPRVLYLTGIFPAAAEKRDVISAWKLHLEGEGIDAGPAVSCDGSVDKTSVRTLHDLSLASAANLNAKVVDVDWKFAGQVPISQPNTLYGYCQSGTSVADVTYFSAVFGLSLPDSLRRPATTPFFQDVRAKYGDRPGLGVGTGPGPRGEWCTMIGNIADAERDKKAAQDKLRSAQRQIVETGWRFGETPAPIPKAAP